MGGNPHLRLRPAERWLVKYRHIPISKIALVLTVGGLCAMIPSLLPDLRPQEVLSVSSDSARVFERLELVSKISFPSLVCLFYHPEPVSANHHSDFANVDSLSLDDLIGFG